MRTPPPGLFKRGQVNPVVVGRKFCTHCGKWRQVHEFPPDPHISTGLAAHCHTCIRARMRNYYRTAGPLVQARKLEYLRIYKEVKRREAGVMPRRPDNRRSVIDKLEYTFLEVGPLLREIVERCDDYTWLAGESGVPERTIWRLRTESEYVRLDLADRLCIALGLELELVYQGARTRNAWEVRID